MFRIVISWPVSLTVWVPAYVPDIPESRPIPKPSFRLNLIRIILRFGRRRNRQRYGPARVEAVDLPPGPHL